MLPLRPEHDVRRTDAHAPQPGAWATPGLPEYEFAILAGLVAVQLVLSLW